MPPRSAGRAAFFIAQEASARYALGTDLGAIMADIQAKRRTIVRNSRILFGEPTIKGTRILVWTVVRSNYVYAGNLRDILEAYPSLRAEDVETALGFYREHRQEINVYIAENTESEDIPYDKL